MLWAVPKPPKILYRLLLAVCRARGGFYGQVYVSQFSTLTPDLVSCCVLRHSALLGYAERVPVGLWDLVMLSRPRPKWKTTSGQDVVRAAFPVRSRLREGNLAMWREPEQSEAISSVRMILCPGW